MKHPQTPTTQTHITLPPSRLKTIYNFNRKAEILSSISYTIPDDSFTIVELFNRHRTGAPLPIGLERNVHWGDSVTHQDVDQGKIGLMDLSEVHYLKTVMSDRIEALEARQRELNEPQKALSSLVNTVLTDTTVSENTKTPK